MTAVLLKRHPRQTLSMVWDNANTHEDGDVGAIVWGAAGRLVLLYLPTRSPRLNPIEMLRWCVLIQQLELDTIRAFEFNYHRLGHRWGLEPVRRSLHKTGMGRGGFRLQRFLPCQAVLLEFGGALVKSRLTLCPTLAAQQQNFPDQRGKEVTNPTAR